MIMFQKNLKLNDSRSMNRTQKGENRPKITFSFSNSTNNQCKPKNIDISYIIPHMIMFQNNLELNDSKSINWTRNGQNRPKMTFSFPKFNQQQMQA